jgi:hypothetical protein
LRSIPLTYLLVISLEYFFKNLLTYLLKTSFFARKEAKFLIIALVGESPSPDNCLMYLTSSNSCSGARLALAEAAPAYESVNPRCLRAKVLRLMLYFFASARYEKDSWWWSYGWLRRVNRFFCYGGVAHPMPRPIRWPTSVPMPSSVLS